MIYVIKSGVKFDKWTSDAVYETYIRELNIKKKQPNDKEVKDRLVERGILESLMQQWGRENDGKT